MIRGNIFKNWDKTCYIASKKIIKPMPTDDYGNEINYYNQPVKYRFNIQSGGMDMANSGNLDITLYGEKINKVYKAIVPIMYQDKIKEGDIAYLDGATPQGEEEGSYGSNGNYIVDSIRPQNLAIAIYFKKLDK